MNPIMTKKEQGGNQIRRDGKVLIKLAQMQQQISEKIIHTSNKSYGLPINRKEQKVY
ncbi:UNKNOWN [Stylonychia lemnae]|uniref:Uncharacterized protein n=1 Tax=Stylonychia lemnae TaxID=5949 RepID=A0A077ZTK7_STYLE|nr:UNKNOWN [Stylonychia lemnae]|eukprot:CDW72670.1 UNKNOWN [Stylonychia lemnae]